MMTKLNGPYMSAGAESADGAFQEMREAVSGIHFKGWMQNAAERKAPAVSVNERTSLNALIAYVAMQSGESEFRVERRLSDRFNVANMTCLPTDQFDNAIRYLVDGLEVRA